MTTRIVLAALLLSGITPRVFAQVRSPAAPLPRIFIDDSAGTPSTFELVARRLSATRAPVAIGRRVELPQVATLNGPADQPTIERTLNLLGTARGALWLAVPAPVSIGATTEWQTSLRALFSRAGSRIAVLEVMFPAALADPLRRFALQTAATEARVSGGTLLAAGGFDHATVEQLARSLTGEDAPYLDAVVAVAQPLSEGAIRALHRAAPEARLLVRGQQAGSVADAPRGMLVGALRTLGREVDTTAWQGSADALVAGLQAVQAVSDLLDPEVQVLDPVASALTLRRGDADVSGTLWHRLLFDERTAATFLVYERPESTVDMPAPLASGSADAVELSVRTITGGSAVAIDLLSGQRSAIVHTRDAGSGVMRLQLPQRGLVRVNLSEGAEQIVIDRAQASATRQLSVAEIIARHRQYTARLDAALSHYRAHARMEQHFRPSLTDPGYDVVSENRYFVDKTTVEWEELSFSVNGSKWGADRPAFPLLQAEKVLSLPLEMRLTQDYRYELTGTERVDERETYRVRFTPVREDDALYRGTVWIDRETFARVKLQAVQTRTAAPIVSNEETHLYREISRLGELPVFLLARQTARQILLIAGRNLLLEKGTTFSDFRVNDAEFAAARTRAREGDGIMFRDTSQGVRYLVKEGEQRVVSTRATSHAKAMAMGVLIDPSFAFPLPIFGINYLDFEFRGRSDTQLAVLFGGVLVAGNLQRPKLAGTALDASLDFFGIAAPASERLYVDGGEREQERLLTWPLTAGLNLGWQYTAFQKATLQYHARYDAFVRDRTTSADYVTPNSTLTHGLGTQWEYKRAGISVAATGTWFARTSWEAWGPAAALAQNPPRTYLKYAAHASRDWYLGPIHKVHLNGSYFGGQRLDRFSRYQFGLFDDTRIHGVPASGVRFDELAMARGAYGFNLLEQYRLDLFAEQAWGRDRTIDGTWRTLTGLGVALNVRAPWNTILRVDAGKSLLPAVYRDVGSTVVQVMVLKPLK